ncbi:kunitz-type trypsin inhibitor KTI1-like [Neltuma alba]|uniref:kunitz-type trypsin inhibitor KTI1-like n=1 Tax=Neltuma alba TaxID=207710 RepID=UPI0010A4C1C5|nr:kunitz-type trypsin inhibitor KTI1-like [Prosopis alba]
MKTTMFALFLLLAFASSATAGVVLDTNGDAVDNNGAAYYILPDIFAKGGGLALASTDKETCPLTVVQLPSEVQNGLPLRISSPLRIAIIKTDMNVDISFIAVPACASTPSKWTVVEGKEGAKSVKITGYGNTLKGWFRIQNYSRLAYKIVFCPTDADSCEDVGISTDDDGNRRLVISNGNPFAVVFVKATSLEA